MFSSIGIDTHKASLEVAEHGGARWTETPTDAGLTRLGQQLAARRPDIVVVEPSGGYERPVLEALWAAGVPVALVQPRQVRAFIQGIGVRAKTDRLDAKMLALYGAMTRPRLVDAPTPVQQEVTRLVRVRRALVGTRVAMQHRHDQETGLAAASLARVMAELDREITQVSAAIAERVASEPAWARRRQILQSCPGIGAPTVAMLVAELPELGHGDDKAIAALVGVAPMTQQSGRFRGQARIEGGRRQVRSALWMPTLVAMRWNPVIKAVAETLRGAGKPHKVVVIACMRKLVVLLNAMVRNDEIWAPRPAHT